MNDAVIFLQNEGYDLKSIGIDNPSITDEQVMKIAINEQRTIITFDRDYGELIFKFGYKPESGVIYLRWNEFTPEELGVFLDKIFKNQNINFRNFLTVIDKNNIRQRKY